MRRKTSAPGIRKKRKTASRFLEIWKRLKRNRLAMVGLAIILILVLLACFAEVLFPCGYDAQDIDNSFLEPCLEHPFGTDNLGRDILVRIVYGGRITLTMGIVSVGIGATLGVILGVLAGYYGGYIDNIIMRCMDSFMAIPGLLLAIAIAATLGPSIFNVMIAVGIANVPRFARIVRGPVLAMRGQEYVESAKMINASDFRILFHHVIPNVSAPIIVQCTLSIAGAILNAAGLSFLGLGAQPPSPEWSTMISSARVYIRDYWWIITFPGIFIMLAVFALNVIGDGLRDALDPRLKN